MWVLQSGMSDSFSGSSLLFSVSAQNLTFSLKMRLYVAFDCWYELEKSLILNDLTTQESPTLVFLPTSIGSKMLLAQFLRIAISRYHTAIGPNVGILKTPHF